MGGTGAIFTSPVFIVFLTFVLFNTASASNLGQKNIFQGSGGGRTRVKRFDNHDHSLWLPTLIASIAGPIGFLRFLVPCIIVVRSFNLSFCPLFIIDIAISLSQICCCVPSCPLNRRVERARVVHKEGQQSNDSRSFRVFLKVLC